MPAKSGLPVLSVSLFRIVSIIVATVHCSGVSHLRFQHLPLCGGIAHLLFDSDQRILLLVKLGQHLLHVVVHEVVLVHTLL